MVTGQKNAPSANGKASRKAREPQATPATVALREAIRHAPRRSREAVTLRQTLAEAILNTGDEEGAYRTSQHAFQLAVSMKNGDLASEAFRQVSRLGWVAGRYNEVLPTFRDIEKIPGATTSPHFVDSLIVYAHVLTTVGRPEEALEALDRAATTEGSVNLDTFIWLAHERAFAMGAVAKEDEAFAAFELAASLARNRKNPDLIAPLLNNYAAFARRVGQIERALALHDEVTRLVEHVNIPWRIEYCLTSHSLTLYYAGKIASAHELLSRVIGTPPLGAPARSARASLGMLIGIGLGNDELVEASYAPELLNEAIASNENQRVANIAAALHRYHVYHDHHETARGLLDQSIRAINITSGCDLLYLEIARYGSDQTVEAALQRNHQLHPNSRLRVALDLLLRSRLHTTRAETGALHLGDRAAAAFEGLSLPLHRAAALELAERFGEAAKAYAAAGAPEEAKRLRRRRWHAGRPRRVGGQLTKREWEVAKLCASGLRNKEIATRIGVSASTVIFHIRNILRELSLTSRHELREALSDVH